MGQEHSESSRRRRSIKKNTCEQSKSQDVIDTANNKSYENYVYENNSDIESSTTVNNSKDSTHHVRDKKKETHKPKERRRSSHHRRESVRSGGKETADSHRKSISRTNSFYVASSHTSETIHNRLNSKSNRKSLEYPTDYEEVVDGNVQQVNLFNGRTLSININNDTTITNNNNNFAGCNSKQPLLLNGTSENTYNVNTTHLGNYRSNPLMSKESNNFRYEPETTYNQSLSLNVDGRDVMQTSQRQESVNNNNNISSNNILNEKESVELPALQFSKPACLIRAPSASTFIHGASTTRATTESNPLNYNNEDNISQERLSNSMRRRRGSSVVTVTNDTVVLDDKRNAAQLLPTPTPKTSVTTTLNGEAPCIPGNTCTLPLSSLHTENMNTVDANKNTQIINEVGLHHRGDKISGTIQPSPLSLASMRNQQSFPQVACHSSQVPIGQESSEYKKCAQNIENYHHHHHHQQQQQEQEEWLSNGKQKLCNNVINTNAICCDANNTSLVGNNNSNSHNILSMKQMLYELPQEDISLTARTSSSAEPESILNRKSSFSNIRKQSCGLGQALSSQADNVAERLSKREETISAYQSQVQQETTAKMQQELAEAQIRATARVRANENICNDDYAHSVSSSNAPFVERLEQVEQQRNQQQESRSLERSNVCNVRAPEAKVSSTIMSGRESKENYEKHYSNIYSDNTNQLTIDNNIENQVQFRHGCESSTSETKCNYNEANTTIPNEMTKEESTDASDRITQTHSPMLVLYERPLRLRRNNSSSGTSSVNSNNMISELDYPVKTYGDDCTEIKVYDGDNDGTTNALVSTFNVDELVAHRRASTAIDSIIANNVKTYFVHGYPVCLFGLDSSALIQGTNTLESPSSLMIEKLITDVIGEIRNKEKSSTSNDNNCNRRCKLYCAIMMVFTDNAGTSSDQYVDLLTCKKIKETNEENKESKMGVSVSQEEIEKESEHLGRNVSSVSEKNRTKNFNNTEQYNYNKESLIKESQLQNLPILRFTTVESIGIQFSNVSYHHVNDEETFISLFTSAQGKANDVVGAFATVGNKAMEMCNNYYFVISCVLVQGQKEIISIICEEINNKCKSKEVRNNDNDDSDDKLPKWLDKEISNANKQSYKQQKENCNIIQSDKLLEKPNLNLHIPENDVVISTLTCVTVEDHLEICERALAGVNNKRVNNWESEKTRRNNIMNSQIVKMQASNLFDELLMVPWYFASVCAIDPRNIDAKAVLTVQQNIAHNREFTVLFQQGFVK